MSGHGVTDESMTYKEYLLAVLTAQKVYPEWRAGQTYFNVLYIHRPELADWVRGTQFDPLYDDGRIEMFLVYIHDNWRAFGNE